jgi:hypothetical protein
LRTPSWDDFREFLRHDDWEEDRATGHDFFEKTLPEGDVLRTHASRSGSKTMSPGRFRAILSDQLRLSEAEFWDVLRTRSPPPRPSPAPEPAPRSLPLWLARALEREVGLTREQIAKLDEDEARATLNDARSRPRE